ncbi:hypothetical protein ACOI1H_21435 [Loktanella sp. DJP18]|uniref:hypothetical protein n=1 Tax=Loktanella sp. DJP18 TaxID=3409788 RepID=UPI003BB601FC
MAAFTMSEHMRLALLERFAPAEIIERSVEPERGGFPDRHRFHIWGYMDGTRVDILVNSGGIFDTPRVQAMSIEPPSETRLPSNAIKDAVYQVLGLPADRD